VRSARLRAYAELRCVRGMLHGKRAMHSLCSASVARCVPALRYHRYCFISCDTDAEALDSTSMPLADAIAQCYEAGSAFFNLPTAVRAEYTEAKAQQRDCFG
jgi:hypothetical protein